MQLSLTLHFWNVALSMLQPMGYFAEALTHQTKELE